MDEQTKKIFLDNFLRWAVFAECEAKNDGIITKFNRLIAVFQNPFQAEDFIKNCLPIENFNRFHVVDLQI